MKTVLITGVSRGIGEALAKRFLDNGDFVIGTSTKGIAELQNPNLIVFPLELSNSQSIEECAHKITTLNKKIDVLVNNAGTWLDGDDQPNVNVKVLRETLEVNLIGPIDFTERVLPLINEGGHIINISSLRGSLGNDEKRLYPDYSISKCALNMFTVMLADRLRGKITVSSLHPGRVQTQMNDWGGDVKVEDAAEHIFKLANSNIETGQFWFQGKKYPW